MKSAKGFHFYRRYHPCKQEYKRYKTMFDYTVFFGELKFTRQLRLAEKELLKIELTKLHIIDCFRLNKDNKTVTVYLNDYTLDAATLAKDIEKLIRAFVLPNSLILSGLIHAQGEGLHNLESIKVCRNKVIIQTGKVIYYPIRQVISG